MNEKSAKARVTFKQGGIARSRHFETLPAALDAAVRLLKSHGDTVTEITVRDTDGQTVFTHEDVERLSKFVRF